MRCRPPGATILDLEHKGDAVARDIPHTRALHRLENRGNDLLREAIETPIASRTTPKEIVAVREDAMRTRRAAAVLLIVASGLAAACARQQPAAQAPPSAGARVTLNGAGATFPFPLYSKWSQVYAAERGVQINYQSIGSGGGIRQFIAKTVDFGATDGPMTDEQIRQAGERVLHIPMAAGAVVPVYNVAGVGPGLNFTPDALADIFLGRLTKWNDPRLRQANPGVTLPDAAILVVHRSDGSGTTAIWVNYLSKVSPEWKSRVGEGTSVNWPAGLGGKGNEGVAQLVNRTPNTLGYVELAYALTSKMTYGNVRNRAGRFVRPSLETTTKAVEGALPDLPADFRIFFTDPAGADAYPIAGFTWILIAGEQRDPGKGKALVEFLRWATQEGQRYAPPLLYAPLPPGVVERIAAQLRTVTANGQPLLP